MVEATSRQGPSPVSIGPLDGLSVIELGSILAGPFAGRLLADYGAEVIKVESPDRLDPIRNWGQGELNGRRLWWPILQRNKRLITLNLRHPAGQALLLELVANADALIENFRPGTLERWNLPADRLHEVNPHLVIVRLSGYGQDGPYAGRAGFAAAAEAISGLRYLNGEPGDVPPRTGISLGDSLAGMFAAYGLLAALYRRDIAGEAKGQVVDVSILESCFALLESVVPEYDRLGRVRQASGARLSGNAPSNVYRSSDDKLVVIAANQDALFRRLCEVMNRPDLAVDPRLADHVGRGSHEDELDGEIQAWASKHTAAEIDQMLAAAGVVCGPINTIADVFEDPQVRAREMLVSHLDDELGPLLGPGVFPKLSSTPGAVRWSGRWEPGADNREIFREALGHSEREIEEWRNDGVL